jgi:hypothetical protein
MNTKNGIVRGGCILSKRTTLAITLLAAILFSPAALGAQTVSVYGDFQEKLFGRSEKRNPETLRSYGLASLSHGRFKSFGPDGVLTAVVLERRTAMKLRDAAGSGQGAALGGGRLWIEKKTGRETFNFHNPASGLRFAFSLEEPDKRVLGIIGQAYRRDPATRAQVEDRYRRNYVVRLLGANGFLSPRSERPLFEEALVFATLIGDRDQWLYGLHDGNAFFTDLVSFDNYRNYFKNADRMYEFIDRVDRESGDFPRNLLHAVIRETVDEPMASSAVLLPEEFIENRRGSFREFAYFYFDILKRKRYESKIVCLKKSRADDAFEYVTLFRKPGRVGSDWSVFRGRDLVENLDADFRLVPARLYGGEAVYTVIDPLEFLVDRRMSSPDSLPDGAWKESRL